jgi:hypothetical protein
LASLAHGSLQQDAQCFQHIAPIVGNEESGSFHDGATIVAAAIEIPCHQLTLNRVSGGMSIASMQKQPLMEN